MIYVDDVTKINIEKCNPVWLEIPDSIQNVNSWDCGSGKTNAQLNLINHKPNIDKIYLYVKDLYEAKYQVLFNKKRKYRLKAF